jgi:hypothetical protein
LIWNPVGSVLFSIFDYNATCFFCFQASDMPFNVVTVTWSIIRTKLPRVIHTKEAAHRGFNDRIDVETQRQIDLFDLPYSDYIICHQIGHRLCGEAADVYGER